jgi:hypothetical protein
MKFEVLIIFVETDMVGQISPNFNEEIIFIRFEVLYIIVHFPLLIKSHFYKFLWICFS